MVNYWLPVMQDWRSRIAQVERQAPDQAGWNALVELAGHQLTGPQVERLDRALLQQFGESPPAGLTSRPVHLAVLGSSTVTHLLPSIRIAGLRRGLWVTTFTAGYGLYRQVLAAGSADLGGFEPTASLLTLDARHLLAGANPRLSAAEADREVARIVGEMTLLWRQARAQGSGQVIQQTVLPIFTDFSGQNEHRVPGSPATMVMELNRRLREAAEREQVDLLTLDARCTVDGLDRWHDPLFWHGAKQEVRLSAAPTYGELVARLLAAQQGQSAKCLVLDLDNTLWGGVIGDDGVDGITLGQGSAAGEAFVDFQRYCLALANRGILLAICSKNDEANVLAVFDDHPEMVIRRQHLSAIVANWRDKATNLRSIAAMLNIGMDALVFVDDNPFERNLVRQELPAVRVPELPDDPALFARCLGDAGYFEALAITDEDRCRTDQYVANRDRDALLADSTDMSGYLSSLDMRLHWRRFDQVGLKRIVQLVNKTNQFNLTTRRYSEDEIAQVEGDPNAIGLQFRLLDRYGDNGMIAVVIGRLHEGARLEIDSWLMSCRVLGRRVEEAMLRVVAGEAAALGAETLIGVFRPTDRNAMVADLYPRLGFEMVDDGAGDAGAVRFTRALDLPIGDLPFTTEQE